MRNGPGLVLGATLALATSASCAPSSGVSSAPSESSETLSAGWIAPNFELDQLGGGRFNLHAEATEGPIVLVFYRGHW